MTSRRSASPRHEQGFTLIELLVVVVVLGILAAIAVPVYIGQQRSARDAGVVSDVRNTTTGALEWVLNNSRTAVTNTADYVSAGGRVVRSDATVINVTASGTGSFTVCGYAPGGASYTSSTSAYLYSSETRQAARSTTCPGDGVAGAGTGSTGGGASTGTTPSGGASTGTAPAAGTTNPNPSTSAGASSAPAASTPTSSAPASSTPASSAPASTAPVASPSASSTPAADQWVDCASEGGTCSFTGTRSVRYGLAPSTYVVKTLTNGTSCTNDVFGDPAYGYAKQCAYLK